MTRPQLAAALLTCALTGVACGWFAAQRMASAGKSAAADVRGSTPQRVAGAAAASVGAATRSGVGDSLGRESARAQRDPAYLRNLLQRYAAETDLDRKGALLAVLQSVRTDDTLRFALDLAASTDPRTRRDGLALLAAFPLDRDEVRETLVQQLKGERDPAMQAQLLDMLAPALIASEDSAPILQQLARLRASPDPAVRAASVLQTAQWDKSAAAEDVLHRALLDPEPQVRQAAVSGVIASGARSDRLKDALLAIASDATANAEARHSAVMALQNFALNRAEYAVYAAAATGVLEESPGIERAH